MAIIEFEHGDSVECPHCGEEFEIDSAADTDAYFEHVSTCDGEED